MKEATGHLSSGLVGFCPLVTSSNGQWRIHVVSGIPIPMASPTHILAVVLIASGALGARKTYEKGLTTAQMRLESAHEGLGVIDAARRCALIGDVGSTKTELSLSCTDSSKRLKFMGSCTRANRSSFSEILNAGDLCFKVERKIEWERCSDSNLFIYMKTFIFPMLKHPCTIIFSQYVCY
eukprot:503138-Amorphochlora_amoeboformis.AAC.2